MKCQNCGVEIDGKRHCPQCGADNKYDGSVPAKFRKPGRVMRCIQALFKPMPLFVLFCLLIVILAQCITE